MVSVTLSDTWTSHSHSVIGMYADQNVRWNRRGRFSQKPERVTVCVRQKIQSGKEDATPFPMPGWQTTYASDGVERTKKAPGHRVLDIHNIMEGFAHRLYVFDVGGK